MLSDCGRDDATRPRTGTQKRETSPPVVADERFAVGRAAASASIFFSAAASVPAGTSIAPEAIAASSSPTLSASGRSASDNLPMSCATAIFSAISGVASSVTEPKVRTGVLPVSSSAL